MINRDKEVSRICRDGSAGTGNEDKMRTGICIRIDLTNIFFL